MYTLHCTKKLLDRVEHPAVVRMFPPTTRLGNWYATAIFWRPQVALLVSERTLLPVLMPLAPASSMAKRFPTALADVLRQVGWTEDLIHEELAEMGQCTVAKTANRSLLGMMNEFAFMAEALRARAGLSDVLALAMRLAEMPCKPIGHGSPIRLVRDMCEGALRASDRSISA